MGVTDCHVHINPVHEMRPEARALLGNAAPESLRLAVQTDPTAFLAYLDRAGVDRAVLVNYVSPEVVGYSSGVNEWVSAYAAHDPERLIAVGGLRADRPDAGEVVERLVTRLGLRGIKLHPPHQGFAPNAYVDGGMPNLWRIYRAAEKLHLPVMFHTGTSVFPGARSKYGDPMALDDVATDFPDLTILMAHGGRPIWCDAAFYLVRTHPNIYLDTSSIPPARLLEWFPRIEKIADRVLFGSDWPGPGIPGIKEEIDGMRALPLSDAFKEKFFVTNARKVFP